MYFTIMDDDRAFGETLKNKLESEYHAVVDVYHGMVATVYKGNIIKTLIMDTQSTAQTRLRAVFLYHGGERRNFPRGLD